MKPFAVTLLLALAGAASAQSVDIDAIQNVLSGYTGGNKGLPSKNYLTTMATSLASGFLSSVGGVVSNVSEVLGNPSSYQAFLNGLEDQYCTQAYMNESVHRPASVSGPEIIINFSGGACLLNETELIKKGGALDVSCIAPGVTVDVYPARFLSPHKSPARFTDRECALRKTFGQRSDNVVFVLEGGLFDIPALVKTVQAKLVDVLGGFSDAAGAVASSPAVSPILQTVNAATAFLG